MPPAHWGVRGDAVDGGAHGPRDVDPRAFGLLRDLACAAAEASGATQLVENRDLLGFRPPGSILVAGAICRLELGAQEVEPTTVGNPAGVIEDRISRGSMQACSTGDQVERRDLLTGCCQQRAQVVQSAAVWQSCALGPASTTQSSPSLPNNHTSSGRASWAIRGAMPRRSAIDRARCKAVAALAASPSPDRAASDSARPTRAYASPGSAPASCCMATASSK